MANHGTWTKCLKSHVCGGAFSTAVQTLDAIAMENPRNTVMSFVSLTEHKPSWQGNDDFFKVLLSLLTDVSLWAMDSLPLFPDSHNSPLCCARKWEVGEWVYYPGAL